TPIATNLYRATSIDSSWNGRDVYLVGYGKYDATRPVDGLKRFGRSTMNLYSNLLEVGTPTTHLCFGDSGGPALALVNGVESHAGIASFVDRSDCSGKGYYTRTNVYASFVTSLYWDLLRRAPDGGGLRANVDGMLTGA